MAPMYIHANVIHTLVLITLLLLFYIKEESMQLSPLDDMTLYNNLLTYFTATILLLQAKNSDYTQNCRNK